MNETMDKNEWISALADGQLAADEVGRAVQAACADREALATWHAYHVVGDVLRSGELGAGAPASQFLERFNARLAQEPRRPEAGSAAASPAIARPVAAANDFRWKMVAGVASVAAVAAVGWSVLGAGAGGSGPAAQPQLAIAVQPAPVAGTPPVVARNEAAGVMIRDPRLDELLAAHRQFGGASALQMPAGFLRNATFEGPAR
jgi:sigma-E factor negative regulatory protein RseA